MKRISDAVLEIITGHPVLNFGIHHRLLNLSQVARFIHSAVEIQTQKEVRDSAVLMSLSRLQSKLADCEPLPNLNLDKIAIHSGLKCFTVHKSRSTQEELSKLVSEIHSKDGFITLSEGLSETMVFLDNEHYELAKKIITETPKYILSDAASLAMTFYQDAMAASSIIYQITQQVAFHNIKIIGLTTAQQEIHIYLHEKDVRLAFDAVYRSFSKNAGGSSEIDTNLKSSEIQAIGSRRLRAADPI